MADLSSRTESSKDEHPAEGWWLALKKAVSRLSDWFVVQGLAVRVLVIALVVLIPASGVYSLVMWRKQALVAQEVRQMAGQTGRTACGAWTSACRWCSARGRCSGSWNVSGWTASP